MRGNNSIDVNLHPQMVGSPWFTHGWHRTRMIPKYAPSPHHSNSNDLSELSKFRTLGDVSATSNEVLVLSHDLTPGDQRHKKCPSARQFRTPQPFPESWRHSTCAFHRQSAQTIAFSAILLDGFGVVKICKSCPTLQDFGFPAFHCQQRPCISMATEHPILFTASKRCCQPMRF